MVDESLLREAVVGRVSRTNGALGDSVPPAGGWSAHNGGRNQVYLDMHASWVRKNIDR